MRKRRAWRWALGLMIATLVAWRLPAWKHYYVDRTWLERAVYRMDRGSNVPIRFYGLVADQDGVPLPGARVEVEVRGINDNWAYEKDGPDGRMRYTRLALTSGNDGRVGFESDGISVRIESVVRLGYRWLYDTEIGESATRPFAHNAYFTYATDGEPRPYQPDRDSPAIFVLVRDGVTAVRARPSRGGVDYNPYAPKQLRTRVNRPVWPYRPSLPDVRYVPPSSSPMSTGGNDASEAPVPASARPDAAEAKTDLAEMLREFPMGIWNIPVSADARTVRGKWVVLYDLDSIDRSDWVDPGKLAMPDDADGAAVAARAGKGHVYLPEPDVMVPVNGTRLAPLRVREVGEGSPAFDQALWRATTAGTTMFACGN